MPDYARAARRLNAIRERLAKFYGEFPVEGIGVCFDFLKGVTEEELRESNSETNQADERERIRRTYFLPRYWKLENIMHPEEAVSRHLLGLHDDEGESDGSNDEEYDTWRWELFVFSDDLEQIVEINRDPDGHVTFEIDLDGIPLGCRHEISDKPTLGEVLEVGWDVAAECTVGWNSWMYKWYVTHVVIKSRTGRPAGDEILIRCTRA